MADMIKDTLELCALTDRFSILADQCNFKDLVQLYTDDIVFSGFDNGKHIGDTRGKDEIQAAFDSFSKQFLTLYHLNGEKLFDIYGEQASGTTYCQVTLRFEKDGKVLQTQQGLRYQNKYVKVSGEWKIKEMSSDIIWHETREVI